MPRLLKSFVDSTNEPGQYRDSDLPGFWLHVRFAPVHNRITKTYVVNGKPRGSSKNVTITIGRHGVITAEQARIEAKTILGLFAQGINPVAKAKQERDQEKQQMDKLDANSRIRKITLSELLHEYLSTHDLKPKTKSDYIRFLNRCLPDWLPRPIVEITRDAVQARHLTLTENSPAQANYTMRVLRALFSYAIAVYEDTDGKPMLSINPVDRLKHARIWNRITRRQTVIRPHQLADWYTAVSGLNHTTARDLFLLELFTGLRHSEAAGLQWENVDFQHRSIHIRDTKTRIDHMLPMSTYLFHILSERFNSPRHPDYVFPGLTKSAPITDIRDSVQTVIKVSGVKFTEHDLRRTFETTAESLDISYYTLKRLLNHKISHDPTSGYIVSSAERLREAAQKIADHLAFHMGMPPADSCQRTFKQLKRIK